MKLKAVAATIVAVLLVLSFTSSPASAHVLKTDGTIGAVLHISPDDNPISGQPNDYIVNFQDTSGHFQLDNCLCSMTFVKGNDVIKQLDLAVVSSLTSRNQFTFFEPGVYRVILRGAPKQTGDFQAFTLSYTVRVAGNGSSANQNFPVTLWVGISLAMVLVILAVVPAMYNDSKTISPSKGKK